MRFSILIPTLNEERYIGLLLNALVRQTHRDFEVIVVDSNSDDRTIAVINSFREALDVRVLSVSQRGRIGAQRNLAARHARNADLVFFDADVIPAPDFLRILAREVEKHRLDFASCWNKPLSKRWLDRLMYGAFNRLYLSLCKRISPGAVGVFMYCRKTVFDALGGFDPDVLIGEDFDLARRAGKAGYRFDLIKGLEIPFSVRRLDRDGRFTFAWRMLKGGFYYHFVGNIKSTNVIRHEFGKF